MTASTVFRILVTLFYLSILMNKETAVLCQSDVSTSSDYPRCYNHDTCTNSTKMADCPTDRRCCDGLCQAYVTNAGRGINKDHGTGFCKCCDGTCDGTTTYGDGGGCGGKKVLVTYQESCSR